MSIRYAETEYGFDYGAAKIERIHHDRKTGAVWIGIKTPKSGIEVYVTRTGKIRVYRNGDELKTNSS